MFANDDIMLEGPLAHLVSYDTSRSITSIHKLGKYMIGALVLTHIAAIVFYLMRKKNLILPMITGNKTLSTDSTVPTEQPGLALELLKAMLVGASAGLIVYLLVNFS